MTSENGSGMFMPVVPQGYGYAGNDMMGGAWSW